MKVCFIEYYPSKFNKLAWLCWTNQNDHIRLYFSLFFDAYQTSCFAGLVLLLSCWAATLLANGKLLLYLIRKLEFRKVCQGYFWPSSKHRKKNPWIGKTLWKIPISDKHHFTKHQLNSELYDFVTSKLCSSVRQQSDLEVVWHVLKHWAVSTIQFDFFNGKVIDYTTSADTINLVFFVLSVPKFTHFQAIGPRNRRVGGDIKL